MANTLLTLDMITREALRLFTNTNRFIQALDRQYDNQFANSGAKIGSTLRIRLPNDYTVRQGAAAQVQNTNETNTAFVLATQSGVDISFSSVERTMQLDDYAERNIAPMMNNLVGDVASNIMSGSDGGFCNIVLNNPAGTILSPTMETFLTAGAVLDDNSAPGLDRVLINDPWTDTRSVSGLAGLFNPSQELSEQYRSGQMKNALGFDWMKDQTVIKHTSGSFSAGTVNGASQTGVTLVTNAITGTLLAGDIITLADVNAVNRVTKDTTGTLRQFVVTANAANGATSLTIYPAITPAVGGNKVQYQTVDASPANSAAIDLVAPASTTYRQSMAFAPEAITMATADLELPGSSADEQYRASFDGISMRMATQWQISTDQKITRTDVLYGYLYVRPEWVVGVADKI